MVNRRWRFLSPNPHAAASDVEPDDEEDEKPHSFKPQCPSCSIGDYSEDSSSNKIEAYSAGDDDSGAERKWMQITVQEKAVVNN